MFYPYPFRRHNLRLVNMSWGFRFQSTTVLVHTSITKLLFIVSSKCLLLAQFCLAHVFSHGYVQQRKERRIGNVQKNGICLKLLATKQTFVNRCLLYTILIISIPWLCMPSWHHLYAIMTSWHPCKLARLLRVLLMTIIIMHQIVALP